MTMEGHSAIEKQCALFWRVAREVRAALSRDPPAADQKEVVEDAVADVDALRTYTDSAELRKRCDDLLAECDPLARVATATGP